MFTDLSRLGTENWLQIKAKPIRRVATMAPVLTSKAQRENVKTATSSSHRFHVTGSALNASGRRVGVRATLTPLEIRLLKEEDERKEAERRAAMTQAQRHEQDHVRDVPDPYDELDENAFADYQDDVLRGHIAADISHAGKDLTEDEVQNTDRSLLEELRAHHNQLFPQARDSRTRRDRTKIRVDAFAAQLECMANAYVGWSLAVAEEGLGSTYSLPEGAIVEETRNIIVVDMFWLYAS
ncbi:hypothetical protein B0H17DRAFT_1123733 [Mycena rosella]|uniref:Uncharacterized protein n=1 Tax=Mycena rosella TaxID=1033263 RepID=A0AAD7MCY9_MYCRO|nr:hypothetical protein B0H17DRAFT_1123733 [Mycena rosella]